MNIIRAVMAATTGLPGTTEIIYIPGCAMPSRRYINIISPENFWNPENYFVQLDFTTWN